MKPKARQHFIEAHRCAPDISWLAKFARKQNLIESTANSDAQAAVLTQVERLAANLARLGNTHDREYAKLEAVIMEGVRKHETFENAQKELGNLLGFVANKVEREGSPDPWWISGGQCIVFEDYVDTTDKGQLNVEKARQAASHPNWMSANVLEAKGCKTLAVVVTPAKNIRRAALPHVGELYFWSYDDFVRYTDHALRIIRELRRDFVEAGDLVWQARAAATLHEQGLTLASIVTALLQHPLAQHMTPV